MNNTTFVAAAFAVTWGVVLGYLFHVHRAARRAQAAFEREIARVR